MGIWPTGSCGQPLDGHHRGSLLVSSVMNGQDLGIAGEQHRSPLMARCSEMEDNSMALLSPRPSCQ